LVDHEFTRQKIAKDLTEMQQNAKAIIQSCKTCEKILKSRWPWFEPQDDWVEEFDKIKKMAKTFPYIINDKRGRWR
jgi:hypothetical protein